MKNNTKKIKISVITPSYNSGDFIERAIRSVYEQDYENWEHIIMDGCSTDNTLKILEKYKHLNWVSEKDNGQADAMNKGFNKSTGDVIVYLNADDYFFPGAFSAVIEEFKKGVSFVMGNVFVKSPRLQCEFINVPRTTLTGMLRYWEPNAFSCNPVGYFYTREVQQVCPFNPQNHITMDLEFLLDAASKYSFSKIDFTLGCFEDGIRTKTGVSQSKYDYWKPSTLPYFEKYLKDFSLKDRLEYEKDRRQGHAFMQSHMNKLNEKKNKFITIDKIPLISVIIPTYNCGEYISRAIDSVLSQNIKNIEILIIDDASTDDTLSILDQKYSNHPQIKIFSQSINKRQAAARNRGLDLASGEYIFFLDADDWIEKKCLIHLVTIAEEYSAKIVACGVDMVFEDGNREPYHNFAFSYDDEFDALNHLIDYRIGTVVWNKLYSRNFIEKNKLRFTGLYVHEDVLFSIEAAYLCDNYISITNSYYNYFQRKNSSINSKQTGQHLESYIRLYADIINFLEKYNIRKNKEGENICRRLLSAHCSNEIYPRLIRYIQTHDKSEWEDDIWLACEKILGVKGFAVADFLVHALNNQIQLPIKESESNRINAKAIVKKYFGFLLNSRLRLPIRKVYHFMKTKNLIR